MKSKIEERIKFLKMRKQNLFKVYDETKDKIKIKLSNDDIYPISKLVERLEVINAECDCIQKEIEFLETELKE